MRRRHERVDRRRSRNTYPDEFLFLGGVGHGDDALHARAQLLAVQHAVLRLCEKQNERASESEHARRKGKKEEKGRLASEMKMLRRCWSCTSLSHVLLCRRRRRLSTSACGSSNKRKSA